MSAIHILKEGISGFSRTKLATLGSIITIAIALLLLGMFYIVSTNTTRIIDSIRGKVEMEAFLQEPVSQARIAEIEKELIGIMGVHHVQFVSKEDAAKIFKQEFGEDVKAVLDFNPLPPSFKIFLVDTYRTSQRAELISSRIREIGGIDDVIYRREMLEFIERQTKVFDVVGLGIGIIVGISAAFLVANTIRLTIYAKRKSIQTMKLVGASRWFIRAPFIIEGILHGILGGAIAAGILYYLLGAAARIISAELAEFIAVDFGFYPLLVATGVVLGLFGSTISVRRFIGETVT